MQRVAPSEAAERTHTQSVKTPLRKSVGVTSRTWSNGVHPALAVSSGSVVVRRGASSKCPPSPSAWNEVIMEKMTSPSWTATTWRAENERPSRSRSTSRITGTSLRPGPQEVAVQRVREPVRLDGGRGGQQALGRHLPAVEGLARPVVGVAPPEEVAVDPLERQQVEARSSARSSSISPSAP